MTDRELLEAAARAAGVDLAPTGFVWDDATAEMIEWNPLTDDGDAFRLAVKLGLSVMAPSRDDDKATLVIGLGSVGAREPHGDPYAATRRAIVRAAAAMATKETTC
jgi:hypothetical protein